MSYTNLGSWSTVARLIPEAECTMTNIADMLFRPYTTDIHPCKLYTHITNLSTQSLKTIYCNLQISWPVGLAPANNLHQYVDFDTVCDSRKIFKSFNWYIFSFAVSVHQNKSIASFDALRKRCTSTHLKREQPSLNMHNVRNLSEMPVLPRRSFVGSSKRAPIASYLLKISISS